MSNRGIKEKSSILLVFTFCALVLVVGQTGKLPSENDSPYPNELPNLKLYKEARWKSLQPYISTVDDVERLLGKPVSVYDDLLHSYVAGFQFDPEWTVVIDIVDKGGNLPDSAAGHVLHINLYSKKRVSLIGADFSAFRGYSYKDSRDPSVECTVYYDKFGLRYSVYEKDTADKHFHAGDLQRIIYGPSDEATAKLTRQK